MGLVIYYADMVSVSQSMQRSISLLLLCESILPSFVKVFLAQVFFEARKPVHDEQMKKQCRIEHSHGDLTVQTERKTHEANKKNKNKSTDECIEEAKIHGNHS